VGTVTYSIEKYRQTPFHKTRTAHAIYAGVLPKSLVKLKISNFLRQELKLTLFIFFKIISLLMIRLKVVTNLQFRRLKGWFFE
jgi:hypothetical protein